MNSFLDCIIKSQSIVDRIGCDKPGNNEEKDIDDMDLDEKIDFHFKQDNDKIVINNEINRILRINQNISSIISDNILIDLEIFVDNDNNEDNTIFSRLDNTKSLFGRNYLIEMLKFPIRDIEILSRRQCIVKSIIQNKDLRNILNTKLKYFGGIENELMWFWKSMEDGSSMDHLVYYEFPYFSFLNNFLNKNDLILLITNWYKMIVTPISTICSPIYSILIPLVMMKLSKKKIPTDVFFKILKTNIFTSDRFERMFGNNMYSKAAGLLSAGVWIVLYFQSANSSIQSAKSTYKYIDTIHTKVNMLSNLLDNVQIIDAHIEDNCQESYKELESVVDISHMRDDLNKLKSLFHNKVCIDKPSLMENKGAILTAYHNFTDHKDRLLKLIKYIGKLDALNSIARLFIKHHHGDNKYCFVKYKKADSPHIKIKDCWHPYLVDDPILNSVDMGGVTNRSALITGPNAAGKSTFIKTLIMNIYLSQTIGIAAASGMVITPFSLIDTYLHIPDCKGRDSLFEAEMYRSKKYIKTIKNMKKREFAFVVMDEMFSSTNYVEGYAAAYAILNKISSYNNSLSLVTTHYGKLAKLEKATDGRIKNYNFYINRDTDNNIVYPYKIRRGVSNQYIALELLKLNDFDEDIIDVALAESKTIKED